MQFKSIMSFLIAVSAVPVFGQSAPAQPPAAATASPARPSVDEIAAKVQANYRQTKTIQAKFVQETRLPGARRPRTAEGMVSFKLPGKMNWDYQRPSAMQYVSNGQVFFYYNEEEKYLAVKKLEEAFDSPTPSNFLKGLGELKEAFNVREPDLGLVDGEGNYRLLLESKDPKLENFSLTLIIDPVTYKLRGLYQSDAQGSRTTIRFSDIRENADIPDAIFTVVPAEGTRVQRF